MVRSGSDKGEGDQRGGDQTAHAGVGFHLGDVGLVSGACGGAGQVGQGVTGGISGQKEELLVGFAQAEGLVAPGLQQFGGHRLARGGQRVDHRADGGARGLFDVRCMGGDNLGDGGSGGGKGQQGMGQQGMGQKRAKEGSHARLTPAAASSL